MSDPLAAARAFLAEDPDAETRHELAALLDRATAGDAAARSELADRFAGGLRFGTAGLRGRVEAGLSRMNRVVVMKATHALGTWLLEQGQGPRQRGVVVGFDGRHSSRQFAEDTAAVLAGLGIPAHLFMDPVPTPLCAFAVTRLSAVAGVMVTASHNPPQDNGYKVYDQRGAQIIPPADLEIAGRLERAPPVSEIARRAPPEAAAGGLRHEMHDGVAAAYLEGLAREALHPCEATPLRIVYTAMHGVGHRLAVRALSRAGFAGVVAVPSQCDADGGFRTVAFPNPEEAGALDRALALAAEVDAELVLANDPDADRLGVAVPSAGGGFRLLSGNEIGWLLADDAIAHADTGGRPKLVVTTVVSSTLLSRMARDRSVAYAETLTGFKWIADQGLRQEREGRAFVFGYEEALGFTVGRLVRDKDGIGSALRMAELARHLKARGHTLLSRLDELLLAHGMSQQLQWAVSLPGPEGKGRIEAAMASLRSRPLEALGESPVLRVMDAARGEEASAEGVRPLGLPRSDVLAFHAADGTRLVARPSGTEPKIKFYLELVARVATTEEVAASRLRLEAQGAAIKSALSSRLGL